ncbi:MAG TPA: HPr family phosphocarrier protein [Anaerolineae bacterium]|nr:HPr family phosphocarrier protein [Anaerolineae bacterium]
MQEITLTVRNKVGLHARPAALFVQTAKKSKSRMLATKDGKEVNAKSILSILTLGAEQDSVSTITAEGEDEGEAVEALKQLVESDFDEKE